MSDAVIGQLEMIDIEQDQPESFAGDDTLRQGGIEMRAVGQAGQHIEKGKAVIFGAHAFMRDGEGAQMQAGGNDVAFEIGRGALGVIVEGEGGDHIPVLVQDRAGPTGFQPQRQRQDLEVGPKRVGFDVGDDNGLAAPGRRSTGAGLWADDNTINRRAVAGGQAGP